MKRIIRLNEFHPGAKTIGESINYFIDSGEVLGISKEDSYSSIRLIVNYHENRDSSKITKATSLYPAIKNMKNCIDTIIDDGYPEGWIIKEFKDKYL
jgi:hypothetical protein